MERSIWDGMRGKEFLMQFHIQNMICGGCVESVTRAIRIADSDATVAANIATKKVEIASDKPRAL